MTNDLISREKLRLVIRNVKETAELFSNDDYRVGYISALSLVEGLLADAPAVDAAPVVHGRWIERDGKTWCSECGASNKAYKPPFCPHCGAKMDGERDKCD